MRVNCNTVSLKWTNTVSKKDTSHLCFSYYDRTNCVVNPEDHQTAVSWMTFSELKMTSGVIFKDIQPQIEDLGIFLTLACQSSDTDFSSFEQIIMRTTYETKFLVMIILSEIIVNYDIIYIIIKMFGASGLIFPIPYHCYADDTQMFFTLTPGDYGCIQALTTCTK